MAKINSINNKSSELTLDPGASGDSALQFSINGTPEFIIGVDDNDSDKFKISTGSALGTNDTFVVTDSGEITKPLQSAFLATVTSQVSNVTGDNTSYTLVYDTEVFDLNSDFDGTSTFTAPVSGKYCFQVGISIGGIASQTVGLFYLRTSNRDYLFVQNNPDAVEDSSSQFGASVSILADMDASDTATVTITIGNASKVVDIITNGSTDPYNWFSGYLAV